MPDVIYIMKNNCCSRSLKAMRMPFVKYSTCHPDLETALWFKEAAAYILLSNYHE
jgi:hypothetical protein